MKNFRSIGFHRLIGLGLAFAAAGCGGGGDDTGGTTTGVGGTTSGSTGETAAPTSSGTSGTPGSTGSSSTTPDETTGPGTTPASTSEGSSDGSSEGTGSSSTASSGGDDPVMSFFVSSTGSPTGNLGSLFGADTRCQELAEAVGAGGQTWHAYLSIEKGLDDGPVHARDRIGEGPWYNADLVMVAANLEELHARDGDHEVFLDEHGEMVPGQWMGSPMPNQHDILTGTNKDGTLAIGKTCEDWNSEDPALFAMVGHSDGLGPMMNDAEMYRPWNSVHDSGGCHDTAPKGGGGRIYCFAID